MNEIVFIIGKSSSGKDHIYQMLSEDGELNLRKIVRYTTRPMRCHEKDGGEYHFIDSERAQALCEAGKIIEKQTYHTVFGAWKYLTVDDGQVSLASGNRYVVIGTLPVYEDFLRYFGKEHVLPIYIEVEDGIRLLRALEREKRQENPGYAEVCRRFLADGEDFSEENLARAGIERRFSNNGSPEDCAGEIKRYILENR